MRSTDTKVDTVVLRYALTRCVLFTVEDRVLATLASDLKDLLALDKLRILF